jgi:hypothetical protein
MIRLSVIENGPAPSTALGVVKTLLYRPELFGGPFSEALHEAMRGPSEWSAGERELFAGFTSLLNECRY